MHNAQGLKKKCLYFHDTETKFQPRPLSGTTSPTVFMQTILCTIYMITPIYHSQLMIILKHIYIYISCIDEKTPSRLHGHWTGQGSPGQRCILMNFQRKDPFKTVYRENIDCTETDWLDILLWTVYNLLNTVYSRGRM